MKAVAGAPATTCFYLLFIARFFRQRQNYPQVDLKLLKPIQTLPSGAEGETRHSAD
jgi:hypothetical protein